MMKRTLIATSLLALTSFAFAVDGTIHFTGAFTESPCVVNINGASATGTINVTLDTWATTNYQIAGATTDLKPITITLSSCPNMTTANVQFKGIVDGINPDLFAIETGANAATNVGIALYSSVNTANIITPNKFDGLAIPLTGQEGNKTVYASYMATGSTTAGAANADMTIDISYE